MKHLKHFEAITNDPFSILDILKKEMNYTDGDISDVNRILSTLDDEGYSYSIFPKLRGNGANDSVTLHVYNESGTYSDKVVNTNQLYNLCVQVSERLLQLGFCRDNARFHYGYETTEFSKDYNDYIDGVCAIDSKLYPNCLKIQNDVKNNQDHDNFVIEKMVLSLIKQG